MKRIFLSFAVLFCFAAVISAQSSGWLAVPLSLGYTQLPHNIPQQTNLGLPKVYDINGGGAALGVAYEFHHKAFIASIGVEGSYWNVGTRRDTFGIAVPMIDNDVTPSNPNGEPYVGLFGFGYENISDRYQIANVNIPLLLGFQAKTFYMLGGLKYGINVWGESNVKSDVLSAGRYDDIIGDIIDDPRGSGILTNMPNHGFETKNREHKQNISFKPNFAFSIEAGRYFRLSEEQSDNLRFRVALFADYGLTNINANKPTGSYIVNTSPYAALGAFEPRVNALLLSDRIQNEKQVARNVTSFFAGIKLTLLFKLHESTICNCEWE